MLQEWPWEQFDVDPADIQWRMASPEVFSAVTQELRRQGEFSAAIWQYSLIHQDIQVLESEPTGPSAA